MNVLTHPEVVHHLTDPPVLGRDLLGEVLVETRFDGEASGKRRPVVLFTCWDKRRRLSTQHGDKNQENVRPTTDHCFPTVADFSLRILKRNLKKEVRASHMSCNLRQRPALCLERGVLIHFLMFRCPWAAGPDSARLCSSCSRRSRSAAFFSSSSCCFSRLA